MTETQLDVNGMSCPSCVRHISGALERIDGVNEVDVRISEGRVVVRHDSAVSADTLVEAVENAGYEAAAQR